MFSAHFLHLVNPQGLSVWTRQNGRPECIARFQAAGESGVEAFAVWLSRHRHGIHRFLLDLPDEGFHVEQIPPVSGQDRKSLIQRRQIQQFFGTPFATSLSLGRAQEGRHDERVLLVALTHPASLEPWLQCLRLVEARLARVTSASLLTSQILESLRPDSDRGLIISLSQGGIRQTYFEHGKLRFSRLSPAPEGALRDWGEACLREAQKTTQYLGAQRWVPRNTNLPVWLLVRREDFPAITARMDAASQYGLQLDFRLANIEVLARQVGLRTQLTDSDATPLLLHLAQRENGPAQLAPGADRRFFNLWRIRNLIATLGVCTGFGLSLFALGDYRESLALAQQDAQLNIDMQGNQHRYQQLLASLPKLPTSLETLQGVVKGHAALITRQPHPETTLIQISRALDDFPAIRLQNLGWLSESSDKSPEQRKDGIPSAQPVFVLEASLPEETADARAAIAHIQAFADALKRHTGGEILGLRMPFDSESDKTLKSDAILQKQRPSFQVRLRLAEAQP